jgi:hypothetical protein
MKMDLYYANICKHENEKNMTRLWCKIMPKIGVEQTEGNEGSYSDLCPFWRLNSRKLPKMLLCVHQVRKLLENLLN